MKVTVDKATLSQALEAHRAMREWIKAAPEPTIPMPGTDGDWLDDVEEMLTQALAEPAVEPVAYVNNKGFIIKRDDALIAPGMKLYTSPPAEVPLLTVQELYEILSSQPWADDQWDYERAIESAVRRKAGL